MIIATPSVIPDRFVWKDACSGLGAFVLCFLIYNIATQKNLFLVVWYGKQIICTHCRAKYKESAPWRFVRGNEFMRMRLAEFYGKEKICACASAIYMAIREASPWNFVWQDKGMRIRLGRSARKVRYAHAPGRLLRQNNGMRLRAHDL